MPGESAQKYISELYRLAENGEFGMFRDGIFWLWEL